MTCLYCGDTENLGTEHLIPSKRGGRDIPENIFQACRRCNSSKNDRLPSEWRDDLPAAVYELEQRALRLHPEISPRRKKENIRLPKEESINIRLTTKQKAALDAAAAREGLGLSTWLLRLGLVAAQERQP
jgi:hypothetical protein